MDQDEPRTGILVAEAQHIIKGFTTGQLVFG